MVQRLDETKLELMVHRLTQMRHRMVWRDTIRSIFWGFAAAGVAWSFSLWYQAFFQTQSSIHPGLSALIGFFLITGLSVGLHWWRLPGTLSMARKAESTHGFSERLSSALEVSHSPAARGSAVGKMLLADAEHHSGQIDPTHLVPLFDRRTAVPIGVLLIAALMILPVRMVPVAPDEPDRTAMVLADEDAGGSQITVEDLELLASEVFADAENMDNDTLGAAASGFQSLVREAGEGLSQDQLQERAEQLIDQARLGYADTPPAWLPQTSDPLSALGDRITAHRQALAEQRGMMDRQASLEVGGGIDEFESLEATEQAGGGELGAASGTLEGQDGLSGDIASGQAVPREFAPQETSQPIESAADATPAGASTQADDRAGDEAGLGTQPMDGSGDSPLPAASDGEEVTLTAERTISGNRIRIQADPPPAETGEANVMTHALQTAERLSVQSVSRERIGAVEQGVVAQYFNPDGPDTRTRQ